MGQLLSVHSATSSPLRTVSNAHFAPQTLLYAHPSVQYLADEMLRHTSKLTPGHIRWNEFNDGFPDLFIENADQIKNSNVVYIISLDTIKHIFVQYCILTHFSKYSCQHLKIIVPYFGTGTMERIGRSGEVATAFSLSQLLSSLPLNRCGLTEICVLDIHSLSNQFYFNSNQIAIRLETTIGLLFNELHTNDLYSNNRVAIVFPDDGAYKRFGYFFDDLKYEKVICSKTRQGEQRLTNIKQGTVDKLHCVIIDDLVQSGCTLIECGKCCIDHGAASVSAYVAHAIFPKNEYTKFVYDRNTPPAAGDTQVRFENFFVTNSLPRTSELKDKYPFKILSIARLCTSLCFD